MKPETVLPILMRGTAVAMGLTLGASHLFFPEAYFEALGQKNWDGEDPMQLFLAQVVGVLVAALCVGLWFAASDPRRYRLVIAQFFVASALIVPTYLYHLVSGSIGGVEWLILLGVLVLNAAFIKFYPGPNYQG